MMKVPEEPLFPVAEMSLEIISFEIDKIASQLKQSAERLMELSVLINKMGSRINQKKLDDFGLRVVKNGNKKEC
jgi:hypothetical protein